MDGNTLLYKLRNLLNEDSTSLYMDERTSFAFLWESAIEFVNRTGCLKTTQSITTVASQSDYILNADFMRLYMKDPSKRLIIKYNNGSENTFPYEEKYETIIYQNNTSTTTLPYRFCILDDDTLDTRISYTASANGASSGGECTLSDTTNSPFADVSTGDTVNNSTDGSAGIVLSKTSSSALTIALFGGTNNDVTSGDAYVIQPQGRMKIKLDPTPSTSGHTVTVYYIQRPAPVFSDYGAYRIPGHVNDAIVKYAAWLYKYRDSDPNFGDAWYNHFDRQARMFANNMKGSTGRTTFDVSFKM